MSVQTTLGYARQHYRPGPRRPTGRADCRRGVYAARIFSDKLSGSAKSIRPGLAAMLTYARAGDIVVVTAFDRLGRSVAEVTRTIAELSGRRILLRALREGIDTATPTGRAVAAIMATLAESPIPRPRAAHRGTPKG